MALTKNRKEILSFIIVAVVIASLISVFVLPSYIESHTSHIRLKVSNGYSNYDYTGNFHNSSLEPFLFHTPYANATVYDAGYGNSTLSMITTGILFYSSNGPGVNANVALWFSSVLYGKLHLGVSPSNLSVYLGVTGITPDQTADMWLQSGINISFSNDANYFLIGFGSVNMSMGFVNNTMGSYFNFSYIPTFENAIEYGNSTDIYTLTLDLKIASYNVLVTNEMEFRDVV